MSTYRVVWVAVFDAESPEAAVKTAREMQLDKDTLATVFNVQEINEHGTCVASQVIDSDTLTTPAVH